MTDAGSGVGHPLDPVFTPRSVAVIGASSDPRKRGHQVLRALRESGFAGRVYPVNPRGGEIQGYAVHPSLEALPESPDLALVCTPAETVPDVVAACGDAGIRGAVVLAVGFRESGEEGAAREARLEEAARAHGVRVVGPNTSGILNLPLGLNLIGARGVREGSIGLVVQSGNIALALMNEITARSHEGVSIVVGVGNQTDLGFADYLDFLGAHEGTRAIVAYVEGLPQGERFLRTAARVTRRTPVILLKGGRSAAGQAAARSHTGSVAGEYDRLRAALRQAGVVEATRTDELSHLAETLATQPAAPGGEGVAILSDGGGQGTLASDILHDLGTPLATLDDATRAELRALLGPAASTGNPVDLAGAADGDPEVFASALELLAADANVGGVLLVGLFGGYGIRFAEELAEGETRAAHRMSAAMRAAGKPLVVHSMYATRRSEALGALGEGEVPVVESLDVACRCVAETWRRGALLRRPPWSFETADEVRPAVRHGVIARVRVEGRDVLTEPEAHALLQEEGVRFPPAWHCITEEEAAEAVRALAGPAALKVVSPEIPHKSDAGGVVLGVAGAEEAAAAFREIERRAVAYLAARGVAGRFDGVVVSPMLEAPVAELLVGARRDPEVGPVLTVGAGGIWVEVLRDVAHRALPVSEEDIREMLGEMRSFGLMTGARGRDPADLHAVVGAVAAVGRCLQRHAEIAEVEVNPLFAFGDGAVAVDARVFLLPHG